MNAKEQVIIERKFSAVHLDHEEIAEFEYTPVKCQKSYRMVVVKKHLIWSKGQAQLWDEIRYFAYITNDRSATAQEIVFGANHRCNQENLIEQLKNGT